MNGEIFNSQINSNNNNNLLLAIINDLQQVINNTNDNLIIKRIGDIIIKMNFIINENKKNTELIINQISLLNKKIDELSIKNKELKTPNGIYVGQVVNGLREGKGVYYVNNGNKYEGEFKNNKMEGKGILHYNVEPYKGDRYEGDFINGLCEGKGIYYKHNGDRYEGDWKNDRPEGKGIMYYNNGNREMGD